MRPIDADALREAMYHEAFETDSDMQKWDSGCWIRYKMFENAIESAPTISPEQAADLSGYSDRLWKIAYERGKREAVKQGKWDDGRCTQCGFKAVVNPFAVDLDTGERTLILKFCPNCGAKMDGGEDDE